jgi:pyruvate dehydrogenase (quinone)
MTMSNVADLFAATIEQAGVKRIFGIAGDSLNGLTEARRRRGAIEWIHVRHEEVADFATAGEASNKELKAFPTASTGVKPS